MVENLLALWMPILVSTLAAFFASFLCWTVLPHHKPDYSGLPDEDSFLEWIRSRSVRAGMYMFPYCSDFSEMKDPEKKKRFEAGPHGYINVWPGMGNMGRNMALTVLFFLVANVFIAYVCVQARDFVGESEFWNIFQVSAAAGVMAYCLAYIPTAIWFNKPARALAMDILDGLIYAAITGAIFALLWPTLTPST